MKRLFISVVVMAFAVLVSVSELPAANGQGGQANSAQSGISASEGNTGSRISLRSFGLGSNTAYTRYFTDPNVPVEMTGISAEERVELVESLARDSWYLDIRLGTDQGVNGPAFGYELVFNFFNHVGLGAGIGMLPAEYTGSSTGVSSCDFKIDPIMGWVPTNVQYDLESGDTIYFLSVYLMARIYYNPAAIRATPYLILHYGWNMDISAGGGEYLSDDDSGKYYGIGVGYHFFSDFHIELIYARNTGSMIGRNGRPMAGVTPPYPSPYVYEEYDESVDVSASRFIIIVGYNI